MAKPPFRAKSSRPLRAGPAASVPGRPAALPPRDDLTRISGLPAVQALFERRPDAVEKLFFTPDVKDLVAPLCKQMGTMRKPYRQVDGDELARIAGAAMHGGVVALARPRPVVRFDAQVARDWAKEGKPLLLLDGVGNPHNLGAIARTMAFFGLEHLVVSDHPGQALPSEAAFRVAEGGLEWVTVHRAERFAIAVKRLREAGYRVAGTALADNARSLAELPRDKPLAVVMGNEEHGLPPATIAACDSIVRLPGSGHVQSLNVSATAAIVVWELRGRK